MFKTAFFPVLMALSVSAFAAGTATKAPAKAAGATATPHGTVARVNVFNRLMTPRKYNLSPALDGLHDPTDPAIGELQPPLQAFKPLPKSRAGNRINWVKALEEKKITPRWDLNNPKAKPMVMDTNIVFEVKGTMPDVVYPHKQHTEWLDCSNCHPAIFVPKKGADQISMASIMMGQKCGVCHGKVAFPISQCRLCHSKNKPARTKTAR
jgi:c(7)-type cytochrome triheme protein